MKDLGRIREVIGFFFDLGFLERQWIMDGETA